MNFPAEAFDQMQRLWEVKRFNDHQLRCVLRFENRLDAESLKRAVLESIDAMPILGTRFVGEAKPRWTSLDAEEIGKAFVISHKEEEFNQFVQSAVDPGSGPQVRVCHLNTRPYSIAVKMNHMICDASAFKSYLYLLSAIYSGATLPLVSGVCERAEDRSLRCILHRFSLAARLKSIVLQSNQNNHAKGFQFPMSGCEDAQPLVLTRTLEAERTESIKVYGHTRGATVNDVLLTAYYRCLFRMLNLPAGAELRIPVMVDMRRYLADPRAKASLTNLTSTVSTQLKRKKAECFDDTLTRVKGFMDERKRNNLGLNGFIKLDRTYRILGDRMANRFLMWKLKHPLISMTNMGVLDADRLYFGDQCPNDAFLCGSIKYQPYFQLAVSSYEGKITLSSNLRGNRYDRNRILSLLDEIEEELHHLNLFRRPPFHAQSAPTGALHHSKAGLRAVSLRESTSGTKSGERQGDAPGVRASAGRLKQYGRRRQS
jgi:NRPS condensation-like uncharacterized protein